MCNKRKKMRKLLPYVKKMEINHIIRDKYCKNNSSKIVILLSYNYSIFRGLSLVIITNSPGIIIGKCGKDIDELKELLYTNYGIKSVRVQELYSEDLICSCNNHMKG